MRLPLLLVGTAVLAAPVAAQDKTPAPDAGRAEARTDCPSPARVFRTFSFRTRDGNRAVVGLSTTSGSMRDTLGILVTEVTSGGPAEKAGIEEGDRLVSINGTELRVAATDAGDREMEGLMSRRLVRILEKVKPGDAVEMRVYSDGKVRTVKVTTVKASELFKEDGVFHLGANGLRSMDGWDRPGIELRDRDLRDLGKSLKDNIRAEGGFPQVFEFDAPDAPDAADAPDAPDLPDFSEIVAPTPPMPPTAPTPPAPSRHFMRIEAPASPPAPPAPPPAPAPPAARHDPFTQTISI